MRIIFSFFVLIFSIANSIYSEDLALNEIATLRASDSADGFGVYIEPAGDINDDGFNDVWVYQYRKRDTLLPTSIQGLYLYYGGNPMDSTPDFVIVDDIVGIVNIGDMNNDHFDDFIITYDYGLENQIPTLKLYYGGLIFDTIPEQVFNPVDSQFDWHHTGEPGVLTGGHDFNNSGLSDLVIGLPSLTQDESFAAFFSSEPTLDSLPDIIFSGAHSSDYFEYSVNVSFIPNLDGADYLAISERAQVPTDSVGRVFLYKTGSDFDTIPEFIIKAPPEYPSVNFGGIVRNLGDINSDGYNDLAISSGGGAEGFIYFGSISFDTSYDVWIKPVFKQLFKLGDINNDGHNDFGASDDFLNGNTYIYYGGPEVDGYIDVTLSFNRGIYDGFGRYAKGLGDVNGDGYPDLGVSMTEDINGVWPGVVKIYAGYNGVPTEVKYSYEPSLPDKIELNQNYPNPFNPSTTIEFSLTKREKVLLEVYNILGERVVILVDGELLAGEHIIEWDGKDDIGRKVSSGLYFYRLKTESVMDSKKMLLLK